MSTNGVIAKPTGPDTWEGTYHHWDSYPEALGVTLQRLYDAGIPASVLIDKFVDGERVGWSSINVALPMAPAEWGGVDNAEGDGPQSYTARGEDDELRIKSESGPGHLEWAYVLHDDHIDVYEARHNEWVLADVDLHALVEAAAS